MIKTVRLFDEFPDKSSFSAVVSACLEREDGKYDTVLDKTLFFPEEGGQSSDIGQINGVCVDYVFEREGVIFHRTAEPLCAGASVTGEIDFCQRFVKMQNHTGEHIVSGLVHQNFGFNNVGFHLGADEMTADFDGELTWEQLCLIEDLANKAVFECHNVKCFYPGKETLASLEYRSKLEYIENTRIVEIEGVDRCACCAPHVSNTGQVGIIRILNKEKYKGGTRIYMKCGYLALEDYRYESMQAKQISTMISAKQRETAEGVARLLDDISHMKAKISEMSREINELKLDKIEFTEGNICLFTSEGDMLALRRLVNMAREKCSGICAVFSGDDENGYKYIISSLNVDVKAMSKEINSALSGRGGGSSEMIQGSVNARRETIQNFFAVKK